MSLSVIATIGASQTRTEQALARLVSGDRLQQTVRDLVQFGNRQGGTASGDKAVSYIARQFRSFGLHPEVLSDPPKLTYVNERWSLEVVSPAELKGIFARSWLAGFSPSTSSTRARVVELPPDGDPSETNVDSAAVLVRVDDARRLYDDLARKGAACILAWAESKSKAYQNSAFIENLPPKMKNPIPVFDVSRGCALALSKRLSTHKPLIIEFSSRTKIGEGVSKSVVATLHGKSEKYFIVCAHGDSDSGGPGADDNASGDAGVIELARCFMALNREGKIAVPDSSIRFIVWGSEYGSAEDYIRTHSRTLQDIVGVLNFDEIGTGASRDCLYFEGNDQRINSSLLRVLQKVGEDYVGKKSFWREATTNPSQGGTDSYVFLPNYLLRLGVPIVEIPSVTIYTAAWQQPKPLYQPEEWRSKAWKGPADSVIIDFSLYYHSSMDVPEMTTEKEPYDMMWGVKAVGIALLRLDWHEAKRQEP